jgi:Ni/Co efflux regulator RcnB
MKKFLTAAMALSIVATAGAASAQPYRPDRNDHNDRKAEQQYERRMDKAERKYDRNVQRAQKHYRASAYKHPPGYRQHQWNHGERLPASYRSNAYRVDYRQYGLRAPPPGYYYTRVDNDVVLTAAASGLIASVIVGMFQ